MATKIKLTCPYCGETEVLPAGISLLVRDDGTGHYIFRCPVCRETITRDASHGVVNLLRSVRVPETKIQPGVGAAGGLPAMSEDDLIEFGRRLEGGTDPWVELGASRR